MTHDIHTEIAALEREIARCDTHTRERLEPRLRDMQRTLGRAGPDTIRKPLRDPRDEFDETMFDNLPV